MIYNRRPFILSAILILITLVVAVLSNPVSNLSGPRTTTQTAAHTVSATWCEGWWQLPKRVVLPLIPVEPHPPVQAHPAVPTPAAPAQHERNAVDIDKFLAAERWQETGSPSPTGAGSPYGGYRTAEGANCEGAYCWSTPTWQSMGSRAGVNVRRYPEANDAPKRIQDRVITYTLAPVIHQYAHDPTAAVYHAALEWNGGSETPVPNPALPGGTTATYGNSVVHKYEDLGGH